MRALEIKLPERSQKTKSNPWRKDRNSLPLHQGPVCVCADASKDVRVYLSYPTTTTSPHTERKNIRRRDNFAR